MKNLRDEGYIRTSLPCSKEEKWYLMVQIQRKMKFKKAKVLDLELANINKLK